MTKWWELLYYIWEVKHVTLKSATDWSGLEEDYVRKKLEEFVEDGFVEEKKTKNEVIYTISEDGMEELKYHVI
jgi:DNA-binding PadR family transcriptional regulator